MSKRRTIYLACDGFGQDLLNEIKSHLESKNDVVAIDLGCDTYYDASAKVAKSISGKDVKSDSANEKLGVLVCGTGMGVGIVANKFSGIRAATCENIVAARCARAVNNSNVLCLGQLVTAPEMAKTILDEFLNQDFISQPRGENGESLSWWSGDVEKFLASSMEGVRRVEDEASSETI